MLLRKFFAITTMTLLASSIIYAKDASKSGIFGSKAKVSFLEDGVA
ncbi:MAG: hypothetical protein V7L04_29295 [Nostoc sp.]